MSENKVAKKPISVKKIFSIYFIICSGCNFFYWKPEILYN